MRLIDADALEYELGSSDKDIYAKACLNEAPTVEIITVDKRKQILDYLYEFNVRADIKLEELVDDLVSIIEN
jgi:hypothetical protein